ncbi:MAG: PEGA domain-containing protein [Candidatus Methylomirabilales bacterium]
MRRMQMVLSLVGLSLLWGGCASTMMVFTEPGNAEILVDGDSIGRSPVLYAGSSGVKVTARLPGYQDSTVDVSRELFFWGWYLPDAVDIRLEPVAESQIPEDGRL